jgi:hypothetical protein
MPQFLFGLVSFFAQLRITESSAHSYGDVPHVIHGNAIRGAS